MTTPLSWTIEGAPRSEAFDDIYFQPGEGLGESRTVFLEGCGLPAAWVGRRRFTVAELGFGSGLNILALLQLWSRTRQSGQRLQIFSVEAHPLAIEDARRALAVWPELEGLAASLLERWPRAAAGFHRVDMPEHDAVLDLYIGDAAHGLEAWTGQADAWFLDGFSPAKNPDMWSETLMALVAARSAPGARVGTFTVAGAVRRALAAQGFAVDKRPGHGRKRQRLEAHFPGRPLSSPVEPGRVAIVGAGIAAAALARAFAAERQIVGVVAPDDAGASGNPAALVSAALDAAGGLNARLYAQALARAADLYRATPGAIIAEGALRLEREGRDSLRFDKIAASPLFAADAVRRLDAAATAAALHEPPTVGCVAFSDGMVVDPAAVRRAWLAQATRVVGSVAEVRREDGVWRLLADDSSILAEAEVVCLAAGVGLRTLTDLPLSVIRGQASFAEGLDPGPAAAWGGYAVPTRTGVLFGATHDRNDEDTAVRAGDNGRNLAALAKGRPTLARRLEGRPLQARAALRVTAPDRTPTAGALGEPGLFILGALGGRGFATAPLLAEHIAALALGAASPLPADLASAVAPRRKPRTA